MVSREKIKILLFVNSLFLMLNFQNILTLNYCYNLILANLDVFLFPIVFSYIINNYKKYVISLFSFFSYMLYVIYNLTIIDGGVLRADSTLVMPFYSIFYLLLKAPSQLNDFMFFMSHGFVFLIFSLILERTLNKKIQKTKKIYGFNKIKLSFFFYNLNILFLFLFLFLYIICISSTHDFYYIASHGKFDGVMNILNLSYIYILFGGKQNVILLCVYILDNFINFCILISLLNYFKIINASKIFQLFKILCAFLTWWFFNEFKIEKDLNDKVLIMEFVFFVFIGLILILKRVSDDKIDMSQ